MKKRPRLTDAEKRLAGGRGREDNGTVSRIERNRWEDTLGGIFTEGGDY